MIKCECWSCEKIKREEWELLGIKEFRKKELDMEIGDLSGKIIKASPDIRKWKP